MNEDYITFIKDKFKGNIDVKYRQIQCAKGNILIVFIDNMTDAKFISQHIIEPIIREKDKIQTAGDVRKGIVFANSVGMVKTSHELLYHILSGDVVIISDFYEGLIFCEAKNYTRRSVGIPITESVIKGPREGFTEAFVDNISLIRRKARNADLKFENIFVGKKSDTVVIVTYIKGIASEKLVAQVKKELKNMDIDFLLDTNYIEERFGQKSTFFETVGYSEKPDIVTSKLFEGRVAIIVDGTPFVATLPYFFYENFQMADDYYLNKLLANCLRVLRWVCLFISMLLPGLYVALTTNHFSLIPSIFVLRLAISRAGVPFPMVIEVLLMIFFFQVLREAGIRLPQPIGQAMSIVGALILGQSAVSAGFASETTIIIIALSSISTFLTPKLYGAIMFWSILIVIFSAVAGLLGFYICFFLLLSEIASLKSCGFDYLFPMGTLKKFNFRDIILRDDLDSISKEFTDGDDKK
ncbi:GerA spore germination protein [Clostridium acidisoli DSM 12555]|uniref:GerA spore germination protein n=1 Tax=Clostridium acidisoli DSM 12555 TaxID=1121291 RepID=A0A1W1XYD7_9CLOT|nr:spore germination protein [Clostridium acidisoli]SMC28571.1 GerA spore germination protein [Clostridium acidisoli DSM 12555]